MERQLDRLAVKVALLDLITSTPEQARSASDAQNNVQTDTRANRQLSIAHEKLVTHELAFMSAYSDDPSDVTAVCVEEVTEKSIIFRFSANSGVHDSLSNGLAAIARILEDEARKVNREHNGSVLLKAAILLNRKRILSRLRSRHSRRTRDKPSLLHRLQRAKDLLRPPRLSASKFQALSREIDDIQRHFDHLEGMDAEDVLSHRSDDCLLALVTGVNSLLKFEETFRCISHHPGKWDTNATDALLDRVKKLGHYVDASSELLKAARKYPAFSNIGIEFVNLQFSSVTVSDPDKAVDKEAPKDLLNRASNHLGRRVEQIKRDMKETLKKKSRLHAEVQLVLFYEQQSRPYRPRVICASKDACYLCHLLLGTQGKYIMPTTHGRLYTGWKYPIQGLQALLPKFVARVELALRGSMEQKAARRLNPLESTVHILPAITPSNKSDVTAMTEIPSKTEAMSTKRANAGSQGSRSSVHTASTVKTSFDSNKSRAELAPEMAKLQPHERNDTENIIHSRTDQAPEIHLARGETAVHSFTKDKRSVRVRVAGLHIHWECDMSTFEAQRATTASQTKNEFQVWLKWLDLEAHLENRDLQTIDVTGNWDEMPIADNRLFTSDGLILQRGSTLLRFWAIST